MANEFVQTMSDARVDARSLSEFVFKPTGFKVTRRLAPPIDTLQFYIDRFDATKATTDTYVATIPSIVNDAINNTAVEGGVLADTFVTVTANGVGTVARTQRDKNKDFISVKDFGAIGDGINDDTAALRKAIESGVSLHWGNNDDTYLVTETINHTAERNVFWQSNGARIVFNAATPTNYVINIMLDGHNIAVPNTLTIDSNRKASVGLRVVNDNATRSNLLLNNVTARNCRKSTIAMTGADGILVIGNFDDCLVYNPAIKETSMAAGAGVTGSQGASGLSITRNSAGLYAHNIIVSNPFIDEVYCDDPDYVDDQDGIRIFTNVLGTLLKPSEGNAQVIGGVIKNALGRGIKSQCENLHISGTHFIRNRGFARGYGNHEIDMQFGGGSVKDISFNYDGSRPNSIVTCQASSGDNNKNLVSITAISGVRGVVVNQVSPTPYLFQYITQASTKPTINLSGIRIMSDLSGRASNLVLIRNTVSTSPVDLFIDDVEVSLVNSVAYCDVKSLTKISVKNLKNTYGSPCDLVYEPERGYVRTTSENLTNIKEMRAVTASEPYGDGLRVGTMVPKNSGTLSGVLKPYSALLPVGITKLGAYGFTLNIFTAIVSISFAGSSQIILAGGASSLSIIAPSTASSVVTAGATKPETGTFRFYFDAGELVVENNSGGGRVITMLVIG